MDKSVTGLGALATLRIEIRRVATGFCGEKGLLNWKPDARRERALKENGCGSGRLAGIEVLDALEGHSFPFLISLPKVRRSGSCTACAVYPRATSCVASLISTLGLRLGEAGGRVKLQSHDYSIWPPTARQLSCVTVACIFWWKGSSIVLSEYILVCVLQKKCLERFLVCPHTWIVVWLGIAFQDKIIFLQKVMILVFRLLAPLLQMSNYYPFDSCFFSSWLDFFFPFLWRFSFFSLLFMF